MVSVVSVLAVVVFATTATADAGSLAAVRRMGLTQADAAKMEALTKQSPEDCIALGRAACVATLDVVIAAHRSSSSAEAVACDARLDAATAHAEALAKMLADKEGALRIGGIQQSRTFSQQLNLRRLTEEYESRRKEVGAQAAFLEEGYDCDRARDESARLKVAQEVRDVSSGGSGACVSSPFSPRSHPLSRLPVPLPALPASYCVHRSYGIHPPSHTTAHHRTLSPPSPDPSRSYRGF